MTTLSSLLPPTNLGNVTGTLAVANGGTGLTAPGAAGNQLASNGTAWVSQAPVSGGPSVGAVASGSLSNGSTVIVNVDGTVSVVAETLTPSPNAGTPVVFETGATTFTSSAYDAVNQKVVIAYVDQGNSTRGTAVVGTVSGSSISFGTPVVFNTATTGVTACVYDANAQKIVIAYKNDGNSNFGTAIVGTVSGTSISFGSPTVFQSNFGIGEASIVYDVAAQKVVISYRDAGGNQGRAIVGTVSGTSISFGSSAQFSSSMADVSSAYDANAQKVVISYRDDSNSLFGTAVVATVSGTSISFGTPVVFLSSRASRTATAYDANAQKVVVAFQDFNNPTPAARYGTAIVGTVSGTSISFGTAVVFEAAVTDAISATYDASSQRVVISYRDDGNSGFGTVIAATVSGTSISFETPLVFESASTQHVSSVYNPDAQKVVIAYQDSGNSQRGTASVYSPASLVTNLTSENFIGFSDGAYTNGQTATIQILGAVDDAQSGLTAGQAYYVQPDGTLGLTPASPSVFAGTAVAADKIIVKR